MTVDEVKAHLEKIKKLENMIKSRRAVINKGATTIKTNDNYTYCGILPNSRKIFHRIIEGEIDTLNAEKCRLEKQISDWE